MTEANLIKLLKEEITLADYVCSDYCNDIPKVLLAETIDLINRKNAEIKRLEYTLIGVMHSVDKWLDGDELKQDEVKRAATMREKTLRIVETVKSEAIKEFAERVKEEIEKEIYQYYNEVGGGYYLAEDVIPDIDIIAKEMGVEL